MAKVKENKRNLSSWGIIVQEPPSDHVLRRVFFCKSSVKNGPVVNWYELNCWTVIAVNVSKFLANPACHVTVYK